MTNFKCQIKLKAQITKLQGMAQNKIRQNTLWSALYSVMMSFSYAPYSLAIDFGF